MTSEITEEQLRLKGLSIMAKARSSRNAADSAGGELRMMHNRAVLVWNGALKLAKQGYRDSASKEMDAADRRFEEVLKKAGWVP